MHVRISKAEYWRGNGLNKFSSGASPGVGWEREEVYKETHLLLLPSFCSVYPWFLPSNAVLAIPGFICMFNVVVHRTQVPVVFPGQEVSFVGNAYFPFPLNYFFLRSKVKRTTIAFCWPLCFFFTVSCMLLSLCKYLDYFFELLMHISWPCTQHTGHTRRAWEKLGVRTEAATYS